MAHLKRTKAPKNWKIQTKGITFVAKPTSGPHRLDDCIPLVLLLKRLEYASTTKEAKQILNQGKILVDNVPRKDHKFPVGTMDIVSIPSLKKAFIILISDKDVILQPIKPEEASLKLNKVIGKKILTKKRIQLNLYDGRNLIIKKDDYSVGDSVVYDLAKKEIKTHLKLEKGAKVFIIGGKYRGTIGTVQELEVSKFLQPPKIILKSNKKTIETLKDYAFVVNDSIKEVE